MTTTSVSRPFALAAAGGGAAASWTRATRAEQRLLQVQTVRPGWPWSTRQLLRLPPQQGRTAATQTR